MLNNLFRELGSARKKFKPAPRPDRPSSKLYDEFYDAVDDLVPARDLPQKQGEPEEQENQFSIGLEAEKKRNADILSAVLSPDFKKEAAKAVKVKVKVEQLIAIKQQEEPPQPNKKIILTQPAVPKKPKAPKIINQNWKQFLSTTNNQNSNTADRSKQKSLNKPPIQNSNFVKKSKSDYIALDCEFVECENYVEKVARISIVDQSGTELFESYVRPDSKIVDYRTHITGITYGHIKKAPFWRDIRNKVEKILYNKILVGHTIEKDLEVMEMTGWSGLRGIIDVAKYRLYQENGKLVGLKRLAQVFLEKDIQNGTHSSLQDAKATMHLFLLKKDKILKEIERNKKDQERQEKKKQQTAKKEETPE